ncbi:MAG: hypothetical protein ABI912_00605 [Actinomycetota bacterium]
MTRRLLLAAVAAATLVATGQFAAASAVAPPPCVPSGQPITVLQRIADGAPQAGKKLGAGWDAVILGTVTEIRHNSPAFRYRITMHIDSVLGPDLPALYTFFGSSKATYPFEVGKVYAVPVARHGTAGPLLPGTELWANACDPVVLVSDLSVAHEIIARTKPGYQPPAAPTPAAPTEPESAAATPSPSETPSETAVAAVRASRVTFPDQRELGLAALRGVAVLGFLALLIAIVAALESWWSRRHFA